MKEKMIEFLLNNANPSIKRRVKSEILNDLTSVEAAEYQRQILQEPNIRRCLDCQLDNGWFGYGYHGMSKDAGQFENQETCTKYLGEKAVDKNTPALKRAIDAFVKIPLDDLCYRTKGVIYDEYKFAANGQRIVNAACIARAGYADAIDISPQIQLSIDSFKRVLEVDSVLDTVRPRKRKPTKENPSGIVYTFKDYEKWPCRYHLDILAHTNSWHTKENIKIIAESFIKMMKTDRPELIGIPLASWVGHVLGTVGAFPSQGFSLYDLEHNSGKYYIHLEYIEWLARCGVMPYIPALKESVNQIEDAVDDEGICRIPVQEKMFSGWGPYGGLQLEVDWKSKIRRDCDITFRTLLILHYANIGV